MVKTSMYTTFCTTWRDNNENPSIISMWMVEYVAALRRHKWQWETKRKFGQDWRFGVAHMSLHHTPQASIDLSWVAPLFKRRAGATGPREGPAAPFTVDDSIA